MMQVLNDSHTHTRTHTHTHLKLNTWHWDLFYKTLRICNLRRMNTFCGTQVKHLSSSPLLGRLLALSTKIRLGWKSLPDTDTQAY